MSGATSRRPRLSQPLAMALVSIVLWLLYAATAEHPLFGQDPVRSALEVAAVIATGLLFVLGAGWLILSLAHPGGAVAPPTGLQRVLIYAVLTFAASCIALNHFGYDLRAVLTTSAIITAAVGFAMQPTLGSMISGIALNIDRMLRAGDGIVVAGEQVRVESLNWRNVVARKADGRMRVFPNAKLADGELEILPHDQPVRAETFLKAPGSLPPQRVSDLIVELTSDFPNLDTSRPVLVAPTEYEVNASTTRYRVRYWMRRYADSTEVEGELLRRLWYGFQRHRIYLPSAAAENAGCCSPLIWWETGAVAPLISACWPGLAPDSTSELASGGEVLLFGPGERLTVPDRCDGWRFLLLRGEAVFAPEFEPSEPDEDASPRVAIGDLGRHARVQRLADELADHIGPYAEYAVRRAARTASSLQDLCHTVAQEIGDEQARARFLLSVVPDVAQPSGPGLLFQVQRDSAGVLVCDQQLRARTEVTVLAVPPSLLGRLGNEAEPNR